MGILRIVVLVFAVLAVLLGMLWIGQGTGLVRWPASSFMIDMTEWTIRGAILAAAGLLLIILLRRTPVR